MVKLRRILTMLLVAAFHHAFALSAIAQSHTRATPHDLAPVLAKDPQSTLIRAPQPIPPKAAPTKQAGIAWGPLMGESILFLGVENTFRLATEEGTRADLSVPFSDGYWDSIGNLHGWSDGDPFYVNYIGHPMQGAVAGDLWTHNDRAYRDIVFGRNEKYWKGKLRGGAFSFIYSALLEVGLFSEATLGNVQQKYPAQGFVDYVVTPAIGLGWSITEDAVDRYPIRHIESHTSHIWIRLLARGGLNPARSMANVLAFKSPWYRDNRPGVYSHKLRDPNFMKALDERNTAAVAVSPPPGVAPFEFAMTTSARTYIGPGHNGFCIGGGGAGAIRLATKWQLLVDISGCKLMGLEKNYSGDSLTYLTGTRWTPRPTKRWTPRLEALIGGTKLTQEFVDTALEKSLGGTGNPDVPRSEYTKHWEANGFTVQAGGGLELKLNSALAIRVVNVEYFHTVNNELDGINYRNGLQVSGGFVLRMGTW